MPAAALQTFEAAFFLRQPHSLGGKRLHKMIFVETKGPV
jgi:hypothetical protein